MKARPAEDWLAARSVKLLRAGGPTAPELHVVDLKTELAVAKSIGHASLFYRLLGGRFSLDREQAVLERLSHLEGVPRVLGRPQPSILLLSYVSGVALEKLPIGALPTEALAQAQTLLRAMHQAGVVHGDIGHDFTGQLGREMNLIWDDSLGRLTLLDFAGAVTPLPGLHWLYEALRSHDELLLTKLVCHFFPELESHPFLALPTAIPPFHWRVWRLLGKI